jgi:hypothetical protein
MEIVRRQLQIRRSRRSWRTRIDAFQDVWDRVREQLEESPGLGAKTLFEWLQQEYPGRFADGGVRTLQRRIRDWRINERLERLGRVSSRPDQPDHTPIIVRNQRPVTALPASEPVQPIVYSANAGLPDENEDLIRKLRILLADFD